MSEVERFDACYGHPSCLATGRYINPSGEYVLASDYDALAAELEAVKGTDHYQRSLDEMHLRYNVEAELEAVKAEITRVKAESLRVVKVGEACEISNIEEPSIFEHNGNLWRVVCGLGIIKCASIDGKVYTGISRHTTVHPIRLERWEASDEAD